MDISIRKWRREDSADLVKVLNNKKILDNLRDGLPFPYTEKDAEEFIEVMLAADPDETFAFAVVLEDQFGDEDKSVGGDQSVGGDKVIGSIGVFRGDNIHSRTGELGYYLGEDYWGRGYMTRAVDLICRYVFDRTDIIRIYAEPFARNGASCRVLEKAGFTCEGVLRSNAVKNGKTEDMKMYALIKES